MNKKGTPSEGTSDKNHPILIAVISAIAVILAALIAGFFSAVYPNLIASQHSAKLKSFYSGTATGSANSNIEFTQVSEDGQGNINLVVTFTLNDTGKSADYNCNGQTNNDKLNLKCTQIDAPQYILDINGTVLADGHMEGSLIATNTFNSQYHHVYSWNVS